MLPKKVKIVEVGPRDGLQNETEIVDSVTKVNFVNMLSATGLTNIEVGSFVSENSVLQMANTDTVMGAIDRHDGISYSVLVPNEIGMQKAVTFNPNSVAIFTAVSETFCKKNINCSINESLIRFEKVFELAKQYSIPVRGYLSCVLGCPYEGEIDINKVAELANVLFDMGCYEISLGDTIGVGTISKVSHLVDVVASRTDLNKLAVHFHDTYGQALVNVHTALQCGVSVVDSSVAGLGGCPYAKGSSGNLATEELVYMLNGLGIDTGVNLDKLIKAGNYISRQLNITPRSKLSMAKS